MSEHYYSPNKLFGLIKSDADADYYLKAYAPRFKKYERMGYVSWFSLVIIYFVQYELLKKSGFILGVGDIYPTAITSFFGFFTILFLFISFFNAAKYEKVCNALTPIAGTPRCIEINRLVSDYSEASTIRDAILQQGRQLYDFDADRMVAATKHAQPICNTERAEIEAACKTIYGIERNV